MSPSSKGRASASLIAGAALVAMVVVAALISLVWTPHDLEAVDVARMMTPPSAAHPFGTDPFGRDVLSMVMIGAQNSLATALLAVLIGAGVGVPLGLTAAARGGWIDDLIMRGNDLIFAFPAILMAVMLAAAFGPGAINPIVAIGLFNIPVFARVARGGALSLWTRDYVLAARTAGKSEAMISRQHILPNLFSLLLVQAAIQFAVAVTAEAGLSYVGLGVQPPTPSWGRMLAEAQTLVGSAPWLAIAPGAAIFVTVLGLGLLSDGLRDRLDPRLNRSASQ